MNIKTFSGIIGAGLLSLAGCQSEVQPPNIVLIMTDDQGFGDFGFTGNVFVETPVLDQLREESLMFDRFYVSPVCAPTRASLLTGRYHLRTGTTWVTHGKEIMRPEERTLAESLSAHGYATGIFGKWHNGSNYPQNPRGQGFDTHFGFCAGHWNNYFDTKLEYNGKMVETTGYITDVLTDSALAFIEKNKDDPFFCYVPYNAPHGPFQVPDKYFDKYKEKGMEDKEAAVYGMCENIDDNVGRILNRLDDLELSENTIVVFLTDNGPNGVRYNAGMKGIKGWVDEGGVRVPLLIRYPGVIPAGGTQFGLASHIDILPTLHSLIGIEFEIELPLDGIDLSPYIFSKEKLPERLIFSHQTHKEVGPVSISVRSDEYRFIIEYNGDSSLYNMSSDPGQVKDIADSEPEVTKKLAKEIFDWYADVTKRLPYQPPVPVGYIESPKARLEPPEANMTGNVHFKGEKGWANDWLVGFEDGEHSAYWDLDVKEEGLYELHLTYAANPKSDGENIIFDTKETSILYAIPESVNAVLVESPDRVPRGEVVERNWDTGYVGDIKLNEGQEKLSISFNGRLNSQLEIKELTLIRK